MSDLLKQFVLDAHDILERMGGALLALEKRPDDDAMIDELFRAAHTLKGNSGLFDIPTFTCVVHAAEDLLDKVRDRELSIDNDMTDELLDAMDFIQRMVEAMERTGSIPERFSDEAEARIAQLRARLPEPTEAFVSHVTAENPDQVKPPEDCGWLATIPENERFRLFAEGGSLWGVLYRPEAECFFKGEDPCLVLRNVPDRAGFVIRTLEAYGDPESIDVYRCNLEIHVLSRAGFEVLREHFRYMAEQVAVYPIDGFMLSIPTGSDGCDPGLQEEFLTQARSALGDGNRAAFANSVDAMLDIVNPQSKAASALRWLQALVPSAVSDAVLEAMLLSFETGTIPDFAKAPAAASAGSEQASTDRALASLTSVTSTEHTDAAVIQVSALHGTLGFQILSTQRQLLDMPVAEAQRDGRLASISNTLRALLLQYDARDALMMLEEALKHCRGEASFLPLASCLDELLAGGGFDPQPQLKTSAVPETKTLVSQHAQIPAEGPPNDGDTAAAATGEHSERGSRTLKVPQEKIDRLMDLIGEMVVAKNALPYLAAKAESVYGSRDLAREIKAQFAVINRIAEDMQDGIMQVRMLPMGHIFQRFPRLVRDVSRQLGKKVRLVLEGESAEADKHIVESLGDPLIHILRNSLDHGLEPPDMRRAAGKPEEGRILVRASQEGDRVRIEIEDDGRGIDPVLVKRKAFEKGLVDESRLDTLSDTEAIQFIFAPGFSTAETVSNLSGRGVGMDVVNSSLQKIGGQIRLTSEKGKGTRILLTLPLSVSVSNVLMVMMAGQRYGVPMDTVVETVRVPREDIHVIKDRRVAVLRGRVVPLFGADQLLQLPEEPVANGEGEFAVLVLRIDGAVIGLIVDGFAQTTDVILKPLEGPLASLTGFLGSALLGDGSVLLVLDLKELMYAA